MKLLITLVVLVALAAGGYWYYSSSGNDTPQYLTATASRGDVISAVTANGTLNPVLNVQVGSQISGRIARLYADFNSVVKSNQIVAEIDPSTYKASLQRAEADLSSASASLELAQVEARRAEQLFTNNLISASEHDSTIANLHQAEASMQIRQAAVESAKVDLSRCTIYAPVDGVVLSRSVDVGQTVAASMSAPILFQIANDLSKMQINANVSEADIGTVEEGQPVTFTVDAFPDRKFTGKVVQIRNSPTTVQNVVTYDCIIEVSNPDLKLRPGMTANADIIIAQRDNVLKVPNAAFRWKPAEPSTNKTLLARLFGGETKKPATTTVPAVTTTSTNSTEVTGSEAPLTGNEPPEELQKRVGEMRARGDEIPEEIQNKLREYYQSGVLQRGAGGGRGAGGRGGGGGGRRGGGGGAGGFGAGLAGGGRGTQPSSRTVYILAGKDSSNPTPQAVRVRTGISDGTYTEVTDALKDGDVIIIGVKQLTPVAGATVGGVASPFGGGGGGGRGGGRGF